jgi:hypothetical protein
MQQDPKVLTRNAELAANVVLILVVNADSSQQFAVFGTKFPQSLPQQMFAFLFEETRFSARLGAGNLRGLLGKLDQSPFAAEPFPNDVVANGEHIRSQPLRMFDFTMPDTLKNTQQGFLPNVFGGARGLRPSLECLNPNQGVEIAGEVALCRTFTLFKTLEVIRVE